MVHAKVCVYVEKLACASADRLFRMYVHASTTGGTHRVDLLALDSTRSCAPLLRRHMRTTETNLSSLWDTPTVCGECFPILSYPPLTTPTWTAAITTLNLGLPLVVVWGLLSGSSVANFFLSSLVSVEWKRKYISAFVSIGGALEGSPVSLRAMVVLPLLLYDLCVTRISACRAHPH